MPRARLPFRVLTLRDLTGPSPAHLCSPRSLSVAVAAGTPSLRLGTDGGVHERCGGGRRGGEGHHDGGGTLRQVALLQEQEALGQLEAGLGGNQAKARRPAAPSRCCAVESLSLSR